MPVVDKLHFNGGFLIKEAIGTLLHIWWKTAFYENKIGGKRHFTKKNLVENGISAFMNIGFTHHYAITSKGKDVEQKKFYIQIAAERLSTPLGILL